MEIKPTYITFEQAKLLKEKKFHIKVYKEYTPQHNFITDTDRSINCVIGGECAMKYAAEDSFAAPEQWQVVEWLRLNHNIWIHSAPENNEEDIIKWYYIILTIIDKEVNFVIRFSEFNSPQEAISAAIDYILNNLI